MFEYNLRGIIYESAIYDDHILCSGNYLVLEKYFIPIKVKR